MADAPDSKSGDGNIVRVQVPPPAPEKWASFLLGWCFFYFLQQLGNTLFYIFFIFWNRQNLSEALHYI